MKAIIELDVPEWQIGQPVQVYFPDTMMKKAVCTAVKKKESKAKLPCTCGCKRRERWFCKEGDFFKCTRCGKTSEPGATEIQAIHNWNEMIKRETECDT